MLKLKSWLSSLLVLAITAVPVMAGSNDAKTTNENAANATSAEASPTAASPSLTSTAGDAQLTALLGVLVSKGVLNAEEAKSLSGTPAQQGARLLELLRQKGILSAADYEALATPPASAQVAPNLVASTTPILPSVLATNPAPEPQPAKPAPPKFIPAVAPVRVLAVDPPKREGLIPDIKIGAVRVKPYGFYKTSAVYDSSSPLGNDFPLPQFIAVAPAGGDTGPDGNPAFHIKARALRVGTNFEWVDISPKLTLTGKLEFDFEGNFSRTNNRNVSSIRSSAPQIRLGWTRLDYAATDKDTVFALFGQDWTPFGSSTLPATIETTGVGIAFGSLYERAPLIKGGFVHNFGGSRSFKLSPEVAVVLPAFGNLPGDVTTCTIPASFVPGTATTVTCAVVNGLGNQLGFGERQGTDSARPEVEARLVGQFQLDPAPGVAPAQLIVSGVQSRREAIVLKSAIPTCTTCTKIDPETGLAVPDPNRFKDAPQFAHGFQTSSQRWGVTAEAQLPTRYLTLTAKAYRGADLRFFFAGQLFSTFNDTSGLSNKTNGLSNDASSTVVFGTAPDPDGSVLPPAPQRPVRTYGGFVELGLPLSRIFNANPAGRGAGWSMNLHYGFDAVQASDARRLAATAGQRARSDWFFGNLQYKLNPWVTFAFEQGLYETIAQPSPTGALPLFAGTPQRVASDRRSEFATIFTF